MAADNLMSFRMFEILYPVVKHLENRYPILDQEP